MKSSAADQRHRLEVAVAEGNIPTLLMTLFQATGDEKWLDEPYRPTRGKGLADHDDGGLPEPVQNEIRAAAVDILLGLQDGRPLAVPVPSIEQTLRMMTVFLGEEVPDKYGPMMQEELARFSGHPIDDFGDVPVPPDLDVIVIGLGVAGTVAAKHLQDMGVPFRVYEKNTRNGGSWLVNHYPGAGVDTPSHLYSYSFASNDWDYHFTGRDELIGYFDRVLDDLDVGEHVQYGVEVLRTVWTADRQQWAVEVRHPDGTTTTDYARVVVTAVGVFGRPSLPDLPGIEEFAGPQFHPTAWPDDLDLSGKRVAIVGTGASAMQIVPAIADRVAHLTVLQRSPQWVAPFPKFLQKVSDGTRLLLAEFPVYHSWYWLRLFWQFGDKVIDALRADPEWPHPERAMNARNDAHRRFFTRYIEEQLGDRQDLVPAVLPSYPPFGKRILLDNGWYEALRKPNVELVPEAVAEVHPDGLVTASGNKVAADVVVWSTGYDANRFLASFEVIGVDGRTIREAWDDDDPRTYLGICTPGFPNLFMLGGPHSFPGSGSFMFFMEMQMRYIRRLINAMNQDSVTSVDPRPDETAAYNREVDELHDQTVWTHPGMRTYFRNSKGRVCLVMPFLNVDYWHKIRHVRMDSFRLEQREPAAAGKR